MFYSILSACNKPRAQEINFSCARGVVSSVKKNLFNPPKTQEVLDFGYPEVSLRTSH